MSVTPKATRGSSSSGRQLAEVQETRNALPLIQVVRGGIDYLIQSLPGEKTRCLSHVCGRATDWPALSNNESSQPHFQGSSPRRWPSKNTTKIPRIPDDPENGSKIAKRSGLNMNSDERQLYEP